MSSSQNHDPLEGIFSPASQTSMSEKNKNAQSSSQEALAKALAQKVFAKPTAPQKPAAESSVREMLERSGGKPMSAMEAALEAAKREKQAKQQPTGADAQTVERNHSVMRPQQKKNAIAKMLAQLFPKFKGIRVIHATEITQREMMGFLWKAHRSKFINDGRLETVIEIDKVLRALKNSHQLLTATVTTRYSDYLLWIEMSSQQIIAIFPDAKKFS